MSARLHANRDRNRHAKWARRIAADQRLEARRAATILQTLTKQIRSIQTGGRTRLSSIGPLQGAGVVTAILPNGRRSRLRIIPTVAPISEVNRLRSAHVAATRKNSRAIAALAVAYAAAVKQLLAEQVKSNRDLRKKFVEADDRLDGRITKELSGRRLSRRRVTARDRSRGTTWH